MKKNTSGQVIGAQMVSASDGSAFTGSVTVYVTGDGGTQAVGSVGSGACTHEGNGFHTYAPAQGETNYDHVAFTFIGTGAVPATLQVYPSFPQTGDNFARLGAPAGASVSADIAAVKTQTAAIEVDTQDIQSRLPAALVSGRMDASVGAMASGVLTATAIAADAITAAKVAADVTTEIQSGLATASALSTLQSSVDTIDGIVDAILVDTAEIGAAGAGLTALASAANLATVAGYLDTEIAAIKAKTDNLPASPAAVGDIPTAAAVADAVWDETVADHSGVGSTGAALAAAGGSGDPWATALPGAYGAGTAGQIVGDYLDAAVSSISAGSGLDAAGVRAAIGLASANLDTQLSAIVADTNELQTDWANGGRLDNILDARASQASVDDLPTNAELATALSTADDAVLAVLGTPAGASVSADIAAVHAKTTNLPSDPADASDIASAFSTVNGTLSTIAGYVDTEVAAIKAKTDLIPASPAATGDIPTAGAIADAVLDEPVEGSVTLRESIRLHNAALGGKASGLDTTNPKYRDLADTKDRISATVDADGNRTAVTRDLT